MYNSSLATLDVFGLSQYSAASNLTFPLVQPILTIQPWKYIEKEAGEDHLW